MSAVYGRGPLTDENRASIHDLAAKGMKAHRIARLIKRHPATVHWFMYTQGLTAPRHNPNRPASYVRNGKTVYLFSPEEDAFIEALRIQDFTFDQIADLANKRFGITRTGHTMQCRLIMLAAREDAA